MTTTEQDSQTRSSGSPGMMEPPGSLLDRGALNPPNLITLSRLLLAIVLFVLIYVQGFWLTSAVLFVLAASTDVLDGWIARHWGMVTTLGRILDPFVDKIIVSGAFLFLLEKKVTLEPGVEASSGVNAWMVLIVIGREMFITSLRGFLERHGRDFSASFSGKLKMLTQCVAVTASLLSLSPHIAGPQFLFARDVLLWTAVAVTVYSGVDYVARASRMLKSG